MKKQLTFNAVMKKQGLAINVLLSFVVLLLMVTSAPLPQFKGKGVPVTCTLTAVDTTPATSPGCGASRLACITVWGSKSVCANNGYQHRPTEMTCAVPKQLFQASEAFYILSVVTSIIIFICTGLAILDYISRSVVLVLSTLNSIFTLIPWVCMTALWYNNYCGGSTVEYDYYGKPNSIPYGSDLRNAYTRSAAYILTTIGWCIQMIALICLIAV